MTFNKLVGRRIRELRFAEYNTRLTFVLEDDGSLLEYATEGDCCAQCYVQDVHNAAALNDAIVLRTEDGEWEVMHDDGRCNVCEQGFWRIYTDKGTCTIETRVEHNGYYGGRIVEVQ